jgi:glycosyltransferase involved in cell wall biosynthesis
MIHSSTPKAGLLAALAGIVCRVPVRVHTYTGQVWTEMHGLSRMIIKALDAIVGRCSTYCLTDSASQRRFLIEQGVVSAGKLAVMGPGSVAGVELDRFDPDRWAGSRAMVRAELNIAAEACVIVYMGRLRADKGLNELIDAFQRLQIQGLNVDLVLIGPAEYEHHPLRAETIQAVHTNPRIHVTGYKPDPERYLNAADIFAFPSYREGFGTSIIEAAAMGLPTVATRVTGCVDSVLDGQTGQLVPAKEVGALAEALAALVTDDGLRRRLGCAARMRAIAEFDASLINRAVTDKLRQLVRGQ